jgi:NADPH:quinone reductase-like Zn-dependent oxidoreductase
MLKGIGADFVVDPSEGGLIKPIQAFLKSRKLRGVDVLYDPVGGKLFKDSMKLLNWGAQILIIGFTSGEIPTLPANILLVKVYSGRKISYIDSEVFHVSCTSYFLSNLAILKLIMGLIVSSITVSKCSISGKVSSVYNG